MERAKVNGVELAYEVTGTGEPVLLIDPVVPGALRTFASAPGLAQRHRFVRYDRRGYGGSTHTPPPVTIADHAADAAALLDHLGIARAHIIGHSSGGTIALELGVERPDLVHSLALLEPGMFDVPSAPDLFASVAPAMEAYGRGDHEEAVIAFLSAVGGLDRATCARVIEDNAPGAMARTVADAETFFGVELPSVGAWEFGEEPAAKIAQPVALVTGAGTGRMWAEVAERLVSWLPRAERIVIDGVGHLLEMHRAGPVVSGVAEFIGRHPMVQVEAGAGVA